MRSRVVIDASPLLYGLAGGTTRYTRRLIEAILAAPSEFEVVLFGRRMLGPPLSSLGLSAPTVHIRLPRAAEPLMRSLGLVETLCRADLYHAADFYLPLRSPNRAVATIHDVVFLSQPEGIVDHTRLARWVPDFVRTCRRVITISEYSKAEIVKWLHVEPERIDVVYEAADRETFFPEPDGESLRARLGKLVGSDRPYFLAVSCSEGRKNTPMLLDAYSKLLRRGSRHDLVLVWDPPDELRQRFARGEREGRIHFVGRQPDTALRDLYCGAAAIVYPSLYEGFGLPVLEALSCGAPVITSSTTSLPEAGGDAAMYIDPSDCSALIAALEAFENGGVDVAAMREKGLRHAANFDWERTARETLAVYARALG